MDREDLTQRLMGTFLGELADHVRALNRDLVAIEKTAAATERQQLVATLFRTAHSLKGASRSVNVGVLESACHRMEGILGSLRDGRLAFAPEALQALFHAADAIQEAGNRLQANRDLAGAPIHRVLAELDAVAGGRLERPKAGVAVPSPSAPVVALGEAVVRVPPAKLDSLLAQCGEALVARRRLEIQEGEIAAIQETLSRWREEWNRGARAVRKSLPGAGSRTNGASKGGVGDHRAIQVLERNAETLRRLEQDLGKLATGLSANRRAAEQAGGVLEEGVRRVRMLPFSEACEGLARVVRDLAGAGGKEVDLVLEGGEVELDRAVLERMKDPLMHLVRNAVDHGIETAADRSTHGKPPRGRVRVAAALIGATVEVTIEDDGRGVDLAAIREQARKRGIREPEDERELSLLIFQPGFSTAGMITELSGRGVGLDVVRKAVESLHGTVDFNSEAGRGTRFRVAVPLTLTMVRALFVSASGRTFAIPSGSVRGLLRVGAGDIRSIEGKEVVFVGGEAVPAVSLALVLGLRSEEPARAGRKVPVVVLSSGGHLCAFIVDELLSEREVLVKGMGPRLVRLRNVAGATVLPTGGVALILGAANLVRTALGQTRPGVIAEALARPAERAKRRLLLAEDSVTTRTLERSILEAAGYEVTVAPDGAAAWQALQERGADLLISDIDMPRMDGFALTEAVRSSKRFRDLPVVLVTALASDRDRARGVEVGADAYLPKSAFDQRALLEAVARLL